MSTVRRVAPVVAALVVVIAAVVVVVGTISTSSARVSARTTGACFLTAGSVELDRVDSSVELLFDAAGLYPGAEVGGCVDVDYLGSIPADVRLHAALLGGDGLEQFVDFRIQVLPGGCEVTTTATRSWAFDDSLEQLLRVHATYATAVPLRSSVVAGDRLGVRAVATLVDGNDSQGLTADFALTIEARP